MAEEEDGSRELVVECVDGGFKGFVEVLASHTLHDLRTLLADEFDDDMLPAEYYFTCDGVRYSTKQENRKRLWELINRNAAVRIHDKSRGQKRSSPASCSDEAPPRAEDVLDHGARDHGDANKKLRPTMDSSVEQEARTKVVNPTTEASFGVESTAVASRGGVQEEEGTTTASRISTKTSVTIDSDEEMRDSSSTLVPRAPEERRPSSAGALMEATARGGRPMNDTTNANAAAPPSKAPSAQAGGAGGGGSLDESTPMVSNKTSDAMKQRDPANSAARNDTPLVLDTATAPMTRGEEGSTPSLRPDAVPGSLESENASEATTRAISSSEGTAEASRSVAKRIHGDNAAAAPTREPVATTANRSIGNDDDFVVDVDVDDDDDVDDDVVSVDNPSTSANGSNDAQRTAREKSCQVLNDLLALLQGNPLFCSQERRVEFEKEIRERLASTAPRVVVGVLGSTGVGKSSLLNALLDEAAVLPTSGSRGCTAAVVELSFNQELVNPPEHAEISVYRGKVEFMKPQDWEAELRVLVDECSTHEKQVYVRRPDPDNAPDANAAWEKIDQVYGQGTMDGYRGQPTPAALASLLSNRRVATLLAPKDGQEYNSVEVEEGAVDVNEAALLLGGFDKLNRRMRRSIKSWAQAFRRKINDYVYRKGNGTGPQTWPLIRCVKLHGPWNVLSTGACLVDLPGVRDANAARARVSERYLQNCSQIWVVAPIKRAVDDGTAKELLGEQFKRRLLMDGQYGNISFICTQTDDCETTEIMRDHADVAQAKPGRWERMTNLLDKISNVDVELSALRQQEEDLEFQHEEAVSTLDDMRGGEDDSEESDLELGLATAQGHRDLLVEEARERVSEALSELKTWRSSNATNREKLKQKSHRYQRQLKALCAHVRNEYSASCLKEDFINGLKDLYRNEDGETESGKNVALPDDLDLKVFCISANDYLKIQGIKPPSDGPPNCFSSANETHIPSLRSYVHEATAAHRKSFFELFANQVSDIVDRFKLVATEADSGGSTRHSRKCRNTFDAEMVSLEQKVMTIVEQFRSTAGVGVDSTLQPSLRAGASKGHASALATVDSWGSSSRRSKTERHPDKNGLIFPTYQATIRRGGVYVSGSAGSIDFNQELCDPMEKEFSPAWQSIMDGSLRQRIVECETKIQEVCSAVERALVQGFAEGGMDRSRLTSLATAASRNCTTALKASFQAIRQAASDSQRDLNRSLLPKIQERMSAGYVACQNVPRGVGTFNRMKEAMHSHGSQSIRGMFSESIAELLTSIRQLIERIATMISGTVTVVRRALEGVYALCWEDQSNGVASIEPEQMEAIRRCRDALLPELGRMRTMQDSAMDLLGIEREELELDILHVDTLEERQAKLLQQAIDKGEVIDLCDSSDDEEDLQRKPSASDNTKAAPTAAARVKPEPTTTRIAPRPFPQPTVPPPYAAALPYGYNGVPQPPRWGNGYGNTQGRS